MQIPHLEFAEANERDGLSSSSATLLGVESLQLDLQILAQVLEIQIQNDVGKGHVKDGLTSGE